MASFKNKFKHFPLLRFSLLFPVILHILLLLTQFYHLTIPVLFSFLLHEIVRQKFGHSWWFSSAPSGFASSLCSSTDLKHFKNNAFIYFWLCWVSVAT